MPGASFSRRERTKSPDEQAAPLMMTRVSRISNHQDFEIERRREELRDRRWKRHRNMLFSTAAMLAVLGAPRLSHFLPLIIGKH